MENKDTVTQKDNDGVRKLFSRKDIDGVHRYPLQYM